MGIKMRRPLAAPLRHLRVVHGVKETLPISFGVIADILRHSSLLVEFYATTTKICDANDATFVELFLATPHLALLEVFSLCLTCPELPTITGRLAMFLLGHCPNIRRIDRLVTWNIDEDQLDREKIAEAGCSVVMARRSHWSLPWRADDGSFIDDGTSLTF